MLEMRAYVSFRVNLVAHMRAKKRDHNAKLLLDLRLLQGVIMVTLYVCMAVRPLSVQATTKIDTTLI